LNTGDTCTDTGATLLLGLEGLRVIRMIRVEEAGAGLVVHVATLDEGARACPECGVLSMTRKDRRLTRPRRLPYGRRNMELVWHKSRWFCAEPLCPRGSFTEQVRVVPAGARLTLALRYEAGRVVADGGRTVVQAGRDLGISWPTAQAAFEQYAAEILPDQPPATEAVGIDETRRGKPVRKENPTTGKWELVADTWHIGFVDAIGGQGLLGQVEGATPVGKTTSTNGPGARAGAVILPARHLERASPVRAWAAAGRASVDAASAARRHRRAG
jgi:hypothetical protein